MDSFKLNAEAQRRRENKKHSRHVMQRNEVTNGSEGTSMDAYVDVHEILPPYGRLDDKRERMGIK